MFDISEIVVSVVNSSVSNIISKWASIFIRTSICLSESQFLVLSIPDSGVSSFTEIPNVSAITWCSVFIMTLAIQRISYLDVTFEAYA